MREIIINGRVAGHIEGDTYTSHRKVKEHFYIKGRGYPISNDILKTLKAAGVAKIVIIEHGAKGITIYRTTLDKYMNAVLIREGDFEPQRCVPLIEMQKC